MWYNLLVKIDFIDGELLPYSEDFALPNMTPITHASKDLKGHTSTMVTTINAKIQDDNAFQMAKVEQNKQGEAAHVDKLVLKGEGEGTGQGSCGAEAKVGCDVSAEIV